MLLDLFLPKRCLLCGRWGTHFCYRCAGTLEYIHIDACYYCEKRSSAGLTHEECLQPGGLDGVCCFLYYTPVVKQLMKQMKYHLISSAYGELFSSLNPQILAKLALFQKRYPSARLQPVPLHMSRFNARGFNQAEYIAEFVSACTGFPVISCLRRRKATAPQARTASRLHRYWNIRNAFVVTNRTELERGPVILVDDVVTSGNTVKEAARVLKESGVNEVFVIALARR